MINIYIKNLKIVLKSIIILFLIKSCAIQSSPTGGPKDEKPPRIIKSFPQNKSINFNNNKITLEFDEYIKLKNAKKEILINPKINVNYEIFHKKNKVSIVFDNLLEKNTTYTINFRNAVVDITENNIPKDLKYVFSTGNKIDSLEITGKIQDMLTEKLLENIYVLLNNTEESVDIQKEKSKYFSVSNKDGVFTINNIKPGTYKIYALEDINNNLLLDMETESYGFKSELIKLDSNINNVLIKISNNDSNLFEIISQRQNGNIYNINYNKKIKDYKIRNENKKNKIYSILSKDEKTIEIFNNSKDTINFIIDITDQTGQNSIDSIKTILTESIRKNKPFEIDLKIMPLIKENNKIIAEINTNKPIKKIIYDSISVLIDTIKSIQLDSNHIEKIYDNRYKISYLIDTTNIKKELEIHDDNDLYKHDLFLNLGKSSIISVQNDSSNMIKKRIQIKMNANFGVLFGTVNTNYSNFIIELLKNNYEVISTLNNKKDFRFEQLTPDSYIIRILIDENKNEKWDNNNIFKNKEAEPLYIYKNTNGDNKITIRENWEVGPINISLDSVDN